MTILPDTALTYDDVLLVPQYSNVSSRKKLSTQARLTNKIELQIPIVSSNMDTVTESAMAIAMAREGGIGIIHRFMTIEQQANEIARVKKAESFVVSDPITLTVNNTVGEARRLVDETGTGGILILNGGTQLVGIVTTRDLLFEHDDGKPITLVMQHKVVTAPADTTLRQAEKILHEHRIEKLPLVDEQGRVTGLITLKDIMKLEQYPKATKDARGRLAVGAAVGVKERDLERVECVLKAGADCIVVDIAHGNSEQEILMIQNIRKHFPDTQIIGGNVASADGTRRLIDAGADAVKVGVGPGSICVTRLVAGSGVPQLTAVIACVGVAKDYNIPIIADGGIRHPGDTAKALAAGADTVMIGSLLAGTDESPGLSMIRKGHKYKVSRGMASTAANRDRKTRDGERVAQEDLDEYVAEGVEAAVPYRGKAREVLTQLVGGIQSGMSYSGAHSLKEFHEKAIFVKMTGAGLKESMPHDVEVL
ncbi:MAG: IMP dehydrogenase [Chloroflexi bacterium UTCFX4]|nr:MAG: IMP dehydrogenase [Chloroflexi bacterium UTCFX4]